MATKSIGNCGEGCGGNCGGGCGGGCGGSPMTSTPCGTPAAPSTVIRIVTKTVCPPQVACKGRTPWMVPLKDGCKYPAGTLGYDKCGYWWAPTEQAFMPPKGGWRQMDFNKILSKLYMLQNSCCDFIFPTMVPSSSCTGSAGVCEQGQQVKLWCENEVGCYQGKLYISTKENNIWTGVMTSDWVGGMCVGEILRKAISSGPTINYNAAAMRPSAWVRSGEYAKTSGEKPPKAGLIRDELYGGFAYDGSGKLVVPKDGVYAVDFLSASIAQQSILYTSPNNLKVTLLVNGEPLTARNHDDHTGNHGGEENPRPRPLTAPLHAGDVLTVLTEHESGENYLATYDIRLLFQSDLT